MQKVALTIRVLAFGVFLAFLPVVSADFAAPQAGKDEKWEAEKAAPSGWKEMPHPWASGGAYMEPDGKAQDGALDFTFQVDKPTQLKVWPLWWRNGEQLPAQRFPSKIDYMKVRQVWPMAYPDTTKESLEPNPVGSPPKRAGSAPLTPGPRS